MRDWFPLWLSLKVSLTATAIAAVCGVGLAYFLARTKMVGHGLIEAVATLPIVLPPTVLGYYLLTTLGVNSAPGRAWAAVFGRPLVFTQTAAVIAASISAFPFVVRTARVAIEEVDLRLEEVARIAGHRSWWVALRVTLPLARNGILAGIGLGFARALGDFGATVMVAGNIPGRTQTLPVAVYDAVQAGDGRTAQNGSLVLAGIAVVVLLGITQWSTRSDQRSLRNERRVGLH